MSFHPSIELVISIIDIFSRHEAITHFSFIRIILWISPHPESSSDPKANENVLPGVEMVTDPDVEPPDDPEGPDGAGCSGIGGGEPAQNSLTAQLNSSEISPMLRHPMKAVPSGGPNSSNL